jgi:GT2 family glycosyltransferase
MCLRKPIHVITVNHNNWQLTSQMISSAFGAIGRPAAEPDSLLIFDNSENPDELNRLNDIVGDNQKLRLMAVKNAGYFSALNDGLLSLRPLNEATVIICNNDIIFEPEFFLKLRETVHPPHALVVAPDVVTSSGVRQNPHNETRINPVRRFLFDCYFANYYVAMIMARVSRALRWVTGFAKEIGFFRPAERPQRPRQIEQGVGAIYILRPQFFQKFDKLYYEWFLYGEEACLAWQLRTAGTRVWFDPSIRVIHAESQTLGKLPRRRTYEFGRQSYWGYRKLL